MLTQEETLLNATDTPINTDCVITNSTSGDFLVLDARGDAVTPPQLVYEQSLKILPTKDGQSSIKAGATGTVTLNDMVTDQDHTAPYQTTNYELLMATPDCLYPVKATHARYILATHGYDPTKVLADDAAAMKATENFQQTIMAYPSSALAQNFQAAMSNTTNSATSADEVDAAVAKFFAATSQYKAVTIATLAAIQTYYKTYPYVWANYQGSKTYYLYSSDGSTASSLGSVQIKVPTAVPASTDKSLSGFAFTYSDAGGNQKNLHYVKGQFVDDPNADVPGICLQGTFVQKSTLTKVDSDTKVIPILIGTVYDKKTLGYEDQLKPGDDDTTKWSGFYPMLHPKDGLGWFTLIMSGVGVLMAIEMLIVRPVKFLKDQYDKRKNADGQQKDPSPDELKDIRSQVEASRNAWQSEYQKLSDKMDLSIDMSLDLTQCMNDYQKQLADRLNEDQRTTLEDALQTQSDAVGNMLDYADTPGLNRISQNINDNFGKIDGASTAELPGVIPEVKASVSTDNASIKTEIANVESVVSQEVSKSLHDAQESLETAEKTSDSIDKSAKENENGETPDDMEFGPHDFQPGVLE